MVLILISMVAFGVIGVISKNAALRGVLCGLTIATLITAMWLQSAG